MTKESGRVPAIRKMCPKSPWTTIKESVKIPSLLQEYMPNEQCVKTLKEKYSILENIDITEDSDK